MPEIMTTKATPMPTLKPMMAPRPRECELLARDCETRARIEDEGEV
jgi:hypothetical protein